MRWYYAVTWFSIDKDNTLVSFNGQGLSAESMAEAAKACDEFWQGIEFMHLSMYRNLLILDKDRRILDNCIISPPHESMGKNVDLLLGELKQQSLLFLSHHIDNEWGKQGMLNYISHPHPHNTDSPHHVPPTQNTDVLSDALYYLCFR